MVWFVNIKPIAGLSGQLTFGLGGAFLEADGEIDNGAHEGDQGGEAPDGLFFDGAEVLAGDVEHRDAGQQPEYDPCNNDGLG